LLNKVFPLRKCKNIPSSPCLYYHLGTCLGPCVKTIEEEQYSSMLEALKSFMRGNNQKQIQEIKSKMISASENQEYERANDYKKILQAIEHINAQQNVELSDRKDRDIFAFEQRNGYICIAILLYRKGILLGKDVFTIEQFGNEEEQVADMILQYYQKHPIPSEVVVNNETIKELLSEFMECQIVSVTKGKLYELVVSAKENASNTLDEYFLSARLETDKLELLEELGKIINIPTPLHIELSDNSHLQGSSPVGAMIAFINGEPAKSLYRKFKIEHNESRDDVKSMYEVVHRHYKRAPHTRHIHPPHHQVMNGCRQSSDTQVDRHIACKYRK
jgi:excinuclease ABC subunit C